MKTEAHPCLSPFDHSRGVVLAGKAEGETGTEEHPGEVGEHGEEEVEVEATHVEADQNP